ncbi:MAG: hypothetical protein A2Z29_08290 [Chloroflexi bacterium RBG_16_56_11]|nr:MAG: hypothetical protein A2Z29_08290 [Chloroflexi bacterium RBG_16_56_11]
MTKGISLSVNEKPVTLDYFVSGYLDHVVGGIVTALKNTGKIETLDLTLDDDGQVKIMLNGTQVPLSYFPVQIIRSTLLGMVAPLKGISGKVDRLHISICH